MYVPGKGESEPALFVTPTGQRSSYRIRAPFEPEKLVNEWFHHSACEQDLTALASGTFADPAMPETEQQRAMSELAELLRKCRCAQAKLPAEFATEQSCEIKPIQSVPHLIEIRQASSASGRRPRFNDPRRPRIVRLYYCEPQQHRDILLGLHVATKPGNAPDVNDEQNEAIRTADGRVSQAMVDLATSKRNHDEKGGNRDGSQLEGVSGA